MHLTFKCWQELSEVWTLRGMSWMQSMLSRAFKHHMQENQQTDCKSTLAHGHVRHEGHCPQQHKKPDGADKLTKYQQNPPFLRAHRPLCVPWHHHVHMSALQQLLLAAIDRSWLSVFELTSAELWRPRQLAASTLAA